MDIVRREERVHLPTADEGLDLVLLTRPTGTAMRAILASYAPGGRLAVPVPHAGEAIVGALEGEIELEFEDGDRHLLRTGGPVDLRYANAGSKAITAYVDVWMLQPGLAGRYTLDAAIVQD